MSPIFATEYKAQISFGQKRFLYWCLKTIFCSILMIFYLCHIVGVGLSIKHLVDVGEVCVGLGIVIAETDWFQNSTKSTKLNTDWRTSKWSSLVSGSSYAPRVWVIIIGGTLICQRETSKQYGVDHFTWCISVPLVLFITVTRPSTLSSYLYSCSHPASSGSPKRLIKVFSVKCVKAYHLIKNVFPYHLIKKFIQWNVSSDTIW